MFARGTAIALVLLASLLVVGCGAVGPTPISMPSATTAPPTAMPAPPTATLVPQSHTAISSTLTPTGPSGTDPAERIKHVRDVESQPSRTVPPPTRTPRPTPTPRPTLSGSGGGVLAFVRSLEGNWGIYVMNADGSEQRRLLLHGQALAYPEWSPDGRQIAFHKHHSDEVWSIHVMDSDGRNEHRLTHTETQDAAPVWSPDGSQIAFSRDGDIWVMAADGSDQQLLMDDPAYSSAVDWSPDGSQMAFTSERDENSEIYVMAADGSDPQRLTDNPAEDWWPDWSPDGTQIAFMSDRDGDWEIYVLDAAGGNARQLTDNTTDDSEPAWSPDGTQIAFSSSRDTGVPFDTELYIMNADGTDQKRITTKAGMEWGVDWRPRGSEVADPVTVGLYAGDGAAEACTDAADRMFKWMGYHVIRLNAAKINNDDLDDIDILYFPGGSSDPYQRQIGSKGRERMRERIHSGGCFIGTCAGALYASETVIWEGRDDSAGTLGLFPGTVAGPIPDIYPDPEFGMCQVNLEAHPITEGEPETAWILYYNGPFFKPDPDAEVDIVGRYEIGGAPALVAFEYGDGRVFLTGPHPEWEEDSERDSVAYFDDFEDRGSDWNLMLRAARWCLGVLE